MYRFALKDLDNWKLSPNRKPLIIRGGRQVGKTYLVRMFAKKSFEHLLEINLD
jgi:predicted AAA+ superfamily ATPase